LPLCSREFEEDDKDPRIVGPKKWMFMHYSTGIVNCEPVPVCWFSIFHFYLDDEILVLAAQCFQIGLQWFCGRVLELFEEGSAMLRKV
jgi:hypothetical protein